MKFPVVDKLHTVLPYASIHSDSEAICYCVILSGIKKTSLHVQSFISSEFSRVKLIRKKKKIFIPILQELR